MGDTSEPKPAYTAQTSPWQEAMRRALPDLPLPKPPESFERQLRLVLDHENQHPSIRARAAADLLIELRVWFDEFVAKANEIEAINDLTAEDLLHVARRTSELRSAGHEVIVVAEVDEDGNPLRPPEVRPATAEEIAMVHEHERTQPDAPS